MRRFIFALVLAFAARGASAQPAAAPQRRAPEPALRRWFEFQQFVVSTRYRLIRNSSDVLTSNHMQYREQIRARFNLDARKRYTVTTGLYSGNNFIGSWNNTGIGTGDFDGHDHFMRQLYLSAAPVPWFEAQGGGLYLTRGESTEYTSYDEDGYLVGGRLSLRRPAQLYLDEVTVTHGLLGPTGVPNLWKRWEPAGHPNYTQVLAGKRFSPAFAASVDYTSLADSDSWRAGLAWRFKAGAPLSALRYEQYVRVSTPEAAGFAVTAERPVTRHLRLQGGYATVDQHYGGLNSDRVQSGRRLFIIGSVPLVGPLSASIFATHAFDADYRVSIKTRFDAIIAWDVASTLRRTGQF